MSTREATHPDALAPNQRASSIVTLPELALIRRWRTAVTAPRSGERSTGPAEWIEATLQFRFRLAGRGSSDLLSQCDETVEAGPTEEGWERQTITWNDNRLGFRVTWELKWFTHYPAVEWLLHFESRPDGKELALSDVHDLHLSLSSHTAGQPFCLHAAHGGRSERDDLAPFTVPLGPSAESDTTELSGRYDTERDERFTYPPSNVHLPFFNLETPDHQGVVVGLGTVNRWKACFEAEHTTLTLRAENEPILLKPGEKKRGHRVLALLWQGEHLHGQNMFRRIVDEHYVPRLPGKREAPLVSVNSCFTHHGKGYFLEAGCEQNLLPLLDPFARLGAELYIIDAGWYSNKSWSDYRHGDWRAVLEKYPTGFRPIGEKLKSNGMDFGVWFATAWSHSRRRFLDQVDDLIREHGMTCYRHDMNSHDEFLLSLWDTLREQHPDLIWEGCCGGGRNIDLESIQRFHWHQKSDRWGDIESDQCSLFGGNLFLPGGLLNIPTYYTDDYGAWSSFAGQFCLGWHPRDEDFPFESARRQVQLYKRIRPLLKGDFYPLTPCSLTSPWLGYQFHRGDLDRGFALLFRRDVPGQDTFTVRLGGLDPKSEYEVSFVAAGSTQSCSGAKLVEGFEVGVPSIPGAELIFYAPVPVRGGETEDNRRTKGMQATANNRA